MSRSAHSQRRLGLLVAACGAIAAIAVLVVATTSSAAPTAAAKLAASHKCLVMTGSGDPAFVKNFNPYTATGLPSGQFIKGAVYEGLVISPEGGLPAVPWLARSWKWSNGNKTLTLNLAQNVKFSDGTPMTSADVVYSLKGGTAAQAKTMDLVGFTRPDTNIASIAASGKNAVVLKLKTVDSQFIASTLNGAIVVPQHIWSKVANPATYTNSKPVGTGPFTTISRFTTQDYVFSKNAKYWQSGKPLIG
jgi:peptide/nickel transport system substrate-binding protein